MFSPKESPEPLATTDTFQYQRYADLFNKKEVLNLQVSKSHVKRVNLKLSFSTFDVFPIPIWFLIQNVSVASGWSREFFFRKFARK